MYQSRRRNFCGRGASHRGQSHYASRANANFTDSDVYRMEVATGISENLTPHEGQRRTIVVLELAATLQVRKGVKGAKGSRAWAAFCERSMGCWNDGDYWAVASRAGEAVMA